MADKRLQTPHELVGDRSAAAQANTSVKVLQNLGWLLIGPVFRLAVGIPLAGFTAYHLGLEGYGKLHLALSLVVLLGALANLGLNEVLTRTVAQRSEEASALWTSVLTFKAGLLSVYMAILVGVAWLLEYPEDVLWMVLLLGVAQWVMSLDNTSRAVFAGRQQMEVLGGADFAKVAIESMLWFSVLALGYGAIALAGVRVMIAILGFVWVTVMLAKRLPIHLAWPDWRRAIAMLPAGCRFATTSALLSIYERLGIVLLVHLVGPQAVALVSTATTLTEKIFWFAPSVQGAIFPFFSRLHATERDRFGSAFARALRYQVLIAVGCGLGASLLGPWVIRFVFPEEFWTAGMVVEVLGWACAPKLVSNLFVTVLQSLSRERQVSWVSAIQCVVYIIATFFCVSAWGALGFAWAYLVAEGVGVGLYAGCLRRAGAFVESDGSVLASILSCGVALFFATALFPGGRENFFVVMGVLLCFPALLVISRSVSRDDIRYLQGLWMGRRPSVA
jgi:PST family polysaccharide transporter